MFEASHLRLKRMPLNNGSGQMPGFGFGTAGGVTREVIFVTAKVWNSNHANGKTSSLCGIGFYIKH